ncbi:MAG: hydroxyacid dehydrogenase [Isosphaeraceae bacterium]|nr:hydroxyacid dehydrogenase [Isosphaeraceae bacterium]
MSRRPVILSLTKMHEAGMRLLREAGELRMASATDPATLQREVLGADALIIRTGGIVDAALLDCGRDLKVVGRHGVGYDQIDIAAATERGIQVVYTPGANTESVVQHVLAMMIGLSKHFPLMSAALAAGNYHFRTSIVGRELTNRSLGIIGFGRIGRRVGEVAHQAFGMKVAYHDIVPAPPEIEARAGARRTTFEDVLATSEYVTLHVPLDASTHHMIDRAAIARMRPDAILINACRGPVTVEAAVAEALDAGRLFGYGADVFEVEPPPADHPLIGRTNRNLMLTPHSAAQTEEGLRNMAEGVALDVLGVLSGEPPRNPVNDPALVKRNRKG